MYTHSKHIYYFFNTCDNMYEIFLSLLRKDVLAMKKNINPQCQFCSEGKCYINAMTSPEDYGLSAPPCHNCPAPIVKK